MLSESGRCSWSFLGPVCSVMRRLQVFLPEKRKAPPPMRRVSHKVIARRNGKWCPTTHFSVLAWTAVFLIVMADRGAGPAWAERVLAAAMALELQAYRGLGRKRHCRERKKSMWTHRGDRTLPRRTGVQVPGGTFSRSADVEKDLLKEMVERRGACRMPQACISGADRLSTACERGCSMSKEESSGN